MRAAVCTMTGVLAFAALAGCPTYGASWLGCKTNTDCPPDYACSNGQCAENSLVDAGPPPNGKCFTDGDCANSPGGHVCDTANNACVGCLVSTDCGNTLIYECGTNDTCVYAAGYCGSDADCTPVMNKNACDLATSTCVECVTNAFCTTGLACQLSATLCVTSPHTACVSSSDCSHVPATPYCSNDAGICAQCLATEDCLSAQACKSGECVESPPDAG